MVQGYIQTAFQWKILRKLRSYSLEVWPLIDCNISSKRPTVWVKVYQQPCTLDWLFGLEAWIRITFCHIRIFVEIHERKNQERIKDRLHFGLLKYTRTSVILKAWDIWICLSYLDINLDTICLKPELFRISQRKLFPIKYCWCMKWLHKQMVSFWHTKSIQAVKNPQFFLDFDETCIKCSPHHSHQF